MTDLQTFVAPCGGHWIHLRQSFDGWNFELWGRYPFSRDFAAMSEQQAKESASMLAAEHLFAHGVDIAGDAYLSWRLAVRYTAA